MPLYLDEATVKSMLPKRPMDAHKGRFGTLGILAGSSCYRGAALLNVDAALRCGAGIVRLAAIRDVCAAAAVRCPCCTLLPQPQAEDGTLVPDAAEALLATNPTAVLAGSGLGGTVTAMRLVERLLDEARCPLVLDADALNVIAGHLADGSFPEARTRLQAALDKAVRPLILTPHIGEMARLCGMPVPAVMQGQQTYAARYAAKHNCVVVLKSHVTVVAGPRDGEIYLTQGPGNPGLAKGGSGDVLAGVIVSLLTQGAAPVQAAAAGVWLHAKAAEMAAKEYGYAGLSPADLPLYLTRVQRDLGF